MTTTTTTPSEPTGTKPTSPLWFWEWESPYSDPRMRMSMKDMPKTPVDLNPAMGPFDTGKG